MALEHNLRNNWNGFCEFVTGRMTPRGVNQSIDSNEKHKACERSYRTFGTHIEILRKRCIYRMSFKIFYCNQGQQHFTIISGTFNREMSQ
jgi:hypothetical protein